MKSRRSILGLARWHWLLVAAALSLLALALAAHLAARALKAAVLDALGPQAQLGALELGWRSVELHDLVLTAIPGRGWPEAEELRAGHISIVPDWRSLFPGQPWRLSQVTVDHGRLVLLRQRDGRLRVLPSLSANAAPLGKAAPAQATPSSNSTAAAPSRAGGGSAPMAQPSGAATQLHIGEVRLRNSELVYWDASVSNPAHRLNLRELQAEAGPFRWPQPEGPVPLRLQAKLGAGSGGEVQLQGRMSVPPRDGEVSARLRDVDLSQLQPYFLRRGDTPLQTGRLDLELDAKLKAGQLHAPGRVELRALRWREESGLGSIAGVPRGLVLAALERNGRIELKFELQGHLDDPRFSLNDSLAGKFAVGLAKSLGVSVQGVVEGVGGVLRGLLGK
jgi:uncharacterized protein involved in outer membrane biogenesis